jgi:hypothetical protein
MAKSPNFPAPTERLPLIPGEVTSLGDGLEELNANLAIAPGDQNFTHLLAGINAIPHELDGAKVLPAVTYGVQSKKMDSGAVELLAGTAGMLIETYGSDYFNPHGPIRQRAQNLVDSAKTPRQARAYSFGLPSYVLGGSTERHLFVGGTDSDLDTLSPEYAEALAEAYDLGSVVLGNTVSFGDIKVDLGKTSLPSLIREIGQTIGTTDGLRGSARDAMLRHSRDNLSNGKSPDYRPYLGLRR